jgi:hypothetical protein
VWALLLRKQSFSAERTEWQSWFTLASHVNRIVIHPQWQVTNTCRSLHLSWWDCFIK